MCLLSWPLIGQDHHPSWPSISLTLIFMSDSLWQVPGSKTFTIESQDYPITLTPISRFKIYQMEPWILWFRGCVRNLWAWCWLWWRLWLWPARDEYLYHLRWLGACDRKCLVYIEQINSTMHLLSKYLMPVSFNLRAVQYWRQPIILLKLHTFWRKKCFFLVHVFLVMTSLRFSTMINIPALPVRAEPTQTWFEFEFEFLFLLLAGMHSTDNNNTFLFITRHKPSSPHTYICYIQSNPNLQNLLNFSFLMPLLQMLLVGICFKFSLEMLAAATQVAWLSMLASDWLSSARPGLWLVHTSASSQATIIKLNNPSLIAMISLTARASCSHYNDIRKQSQTWIKTQTTAAAGFRLKIHHKHDQQDLLLNDFCFLEKLYQGIF